RTRTAYFLPCFRITLFLRPVPYLNSTITLVVENLADRGRPPSALLGTTRWLRCKHPFPVEFLSHLSQTHAVGTHLEQPHNDICIFTIDFCSNSDNGRSSILRGS